MPGTGFPETMRLRGVYDLGMAKAPTREDHRAVMQIALSGLAAGMPLGEIGRRLEPIASRGVV